MPLRKPLPLATIEAQLFALITGHAAPAGGDTGVGLPRAEDTVVSDQRAGAAERVAIYAEMYRARLVEALESEYPRLAARLGRDAFEAVAVGYLSEHPSRHPSLRALGQHFAAWLAAQPGQPAQSAWLSDLARLEWARADVFDAVDEPPLAQTTVARLGAAALADLSIKLIAASRLITVTAAACAAWEGNGNGHSDDDASSNGSGSGSGSDKPKAADATRVRVLVWRPGDADARTNATAVYHRIVDAAEAEALDLARTGATFADICEAAAEAAHDSTELADIATRAFGWLASWTADGLLVAR